MINPREMLGAATLGEDAFAQWSNSDNSRDVSVNISSATDDVKDDALLLGCATSDELRSKWTSGCVRTGT